MKDAHTTGDLSRLQRYKQFLGKPWREQRRSIAFRYLRQVPHAVIPIRLPIGAWWFAENDFMGAALLWSSFEDAEYELVRSIVRPGMTVLDIGAHKGFYSLLLSRAVGPEGRVFSFEPSRRERSRLKFHLRVNSCRNVTVFDFALGRDEEQAQLFVVDGTETGLNSLRPPKENVSTHPETVRIRPLDTVLTEQRIDRVDFLKIDVEGGELDVFSGATKLLKQVPRPIVLAEVSDDRARQWGHSANELLLFFEHLNFRWLAIRAGGELLPVDRQKSFYNDNFLAVPEERISELLHASETPEARANASAANGER